MYWRNTYAYAINPALRIVYEGKRSAVFLSDLLVFKPHWFSSVAFTTSQRAFFEYLAVRITALAIVHTGASIIAASHEIYIS